MPYLIALIVAMLIVTYVPALSVGFADLFMG